MHHIRWTAQDAHAHTCTRRIHASLLLKDARVWHCVRVWVGFSCMMSLHPLSHSHHWYAETDYWDVNGMHAHPQMSCAHETRVWALFGHVHLSHKRCMCLAHACLAADACV